MEKLGVTRLGKTWSGTVATTSKELRTRLAAVVRRLSWHGGGDFELVYDDRGRSWLIDANPRFAAWIHGATLAGTNLPAALVAAASGHMPRRCPPNGSTFTRVVLETSVAATLAREITPHAVE
jgi:predicted ATP-grasp superfamily ATP-dependent carboligase